MKSGDREKFVRLANKRVNSAIKSIQLVGNLSNKALYDYTDEDVEQIFASLAHEIETCRKRFELSIKLDSWVEFALDE